MIQVHCPGCQSRLRAGDSLAGRSVTCPKCKAKVAVPAINEGIEVVEDDAPAVRKAPPAAAQRKSVPARPTRSGDVPVVKGRPAEKHPARPRPSYQEEPDDETLAVRHGVARRRKKRKNEGD